jgi:methionine sulfoxide reductase heme-binding subunit
VVASVSLTWVTTRAAGYTAFALLTVSVSLGLVLSSPIRSARWPRFATTELHRFVTLLTLVFIGVHVLVAMLDRFISFSLVEVLVPFTSHYRPLWMGIGIVSAYLALAVWASNWLQRRIGYAWWRRLHYASFAVYAGAAAHGLGSGSDSGWAWSRIIYVVSFVIVGGLLIVRIPAGDRRAPARSTARPRANPHGAPGPARGTAVAPESRTVGGPGAHPAASAARGTALGPASAGFSARLDGRLWQGPNGDGAVLVGLDAALHSGFGGELRLRVFGRVPPGTTQLEVVDNRLWLRGWDGTTWSGRIEVFDSLRLRGAIVAQTAGARPLTLEISLFGISGEATSGTVRALPNGSAGGIPTRSPLAS